MTNFVFTMTSVVSSLGYNLERYGSYNFGGNIIEAYTGVATTTFGNYHTLPGFFQLLNILFAIHCCNLCIFLSQFDCSFELLQKMHELKSSKKRNLGDSLRKSLSRVASIKG